MTERATLPPGAAVGTVPVVIDSPGIVSAHPMTVGLPLPRGMLSDPTGWTLTGAAGAAVPVQAEALARWPDGSVRWVLLDFVAGPLTAGQHVWSFGPGTGEGRSPAPACQVRSDQEAVVIETGAAAVRVGRGPAAPLLRVACGGRDVLAPAGCRLTLTDAKGVARAAEVERAEVEAAGPVRVTVRMEGRFAGHSPCQFVARLCFFAGTGLARLRLTVHNPRRARHRGGLWDLGDPGSVLFRDLSLTLALADPAGPRVRWTEEPGRPVREAAGDRFEIYQDSSGGANWQSRNHVNRDGRVPLSFSGYRVRGGGADESGARANPVVRLLGPGAAVTAAVPEFWQQFPKAVEAGEGALHVRLFPGQFADLFELQGGEQKTHTVWLHFGGPDTPDAVLDWAHRPADARPTPDWYAGSGSFPEFVPAAPGATDRFDEYLGPVVEGPGSLVARREVIDEYGWRNYGDVYADHENAYYDGAKPVVSHYNNQFDSVFGAILQYARTGDRRWRDLFDPLARHVVDVDIYHTDDDRAAYRGGLFWMTDHYRDAATSTHRTYSRANRRPGQPYGGGPGCEHNFTTGLLYYHYLTGDPQARAAVVGLADWVVRMDDGRLNLLGLADSGPTGLATATREFDYHGPGRGAGFSVNALLDGWLATGRRAYLDKAEALIRRCIHPADDVPARDLLDAERRWSYTVFLTTLARYLALKAEAGELGFMYAYARASLLHYAAWMVDHERPYLDHRERLEFPTETWPAQEFRKANVLRLAAAHADEPLRSRLLKRGGELADRAWHDLLGFPSRHVARAVAILMTEGTRDQFYRRCPARPFPRPDVTPNFGRPETFVPQKRRVKALLRSPRGLASALVRVIWGRVHPPSPPDSPDRPDGPAIA
ncbi:MAG TPA: hypothetical protein VGF55_14840 [Gemmataceae bacterium]|jgi:hypothetical protein